MKLNAAAARLCDTAVVRKSSLRLAVTQLECGARVIDFGVDVPGGIQAGLLLAKICMADQATVELMPADPATWAGPQIQVSTDHPLQACMASQYAGWPVQVEKFFAMGSGPMRALRGREHVLDSLKLVDDSLEAVGVLECDKLPTEAVCQKIAEECRVSCEKLTLCVAPTRSIAGTIQVVARSIETSLHKLFELGFDLRDVISGHGSAPLPPPARDFAEGIGRTNDAILYGGRVTLWWIRKIRASMRSDQKYRVAGRRTGVDPLQRSFAIINSTSIKSIQAYSVRLKLLSTIYAPVERGVSVRCVRMFFKSRLES